MKKIGLVMGSDSDLPIVEKYYKHCLALPMYPTLAKDQQQYVIEKVLEFYKK